MADDQEDKSSKTEEPTERRLQKAREQGNVAKSKEVNNFFAILAMLVAIVLSLPFAWESILTYYGGMFTELGTLRANNSASIGHVMALTAKELVVLLAPTFALFVAFALFGSFIQNGFVFSVEPIKPKLSKISLLKGFERLFSAKSMMEFLKSIIKMVVIGAALYAVFYMHMEDFILLIDKSVLSLLSTTEIVLIRMLLVTLFISAFIAVVDFMFERAQYMKENRMSRKEMKDEYKETEGDPHIKGRQKQIRMDRARARMMQELPTADVVVTNPTHYAVALRYDKAKEAAPRVVAKGVDNLALRIREIAKENEIPLYEDPPLARQLYAEAEIDEEIPLDLYEAVAKVVAFIYNLRGHKA